MITSLKWQRAPALLTLTWFAQGVAVAVNAAYPTAAHVVTVAGPAGPQGSIGGVLTRLASVPLGGNRAVRIGADDKAVYADPANPLASTACGVTEGAAAADAPVSIRAAGLLTDVGWNWVEGPIFCGSNGVLTQVPPATGTLVQMGVSAGPQAMIVSPEFLADLAA